MRKNKLVAFATACSVVASMCVGFVSAQAETTVDDSTVETQAVEKGYELVYDAEKSTATEKYVDAYVRGIDYVFATSVFFQVPEGISVSNVSYTAEGNGSVTPVTDNIASGQFSATILWTSGAYEAKDKVAFTLKFEVPEGTGAFELSMSDVPVMSNEENKKIEDVQISDPITIPAYGATEEPTVKPSEEVTEAPTAEPTATPVVVEKPTAIPTEPAPTEVAPIEKGYELVYNAEKSTATEKYVDAYVRGIDYVFATSVFFQVPSDIKVSNVSYTAEGNGNVTPVTDSIASGQFSATILWTSGAYEAKDKIAFTLKFEVPEGTGAFELSMSDVPVMSDENNKKIEGVELSNPITIPEFGAEEPSETPAPTEFPADKTVVVKDMGVKAEATDATYGTLTALVVNATKGDAEAVYGEDYVAVFDGKELTKDEYQNLINGYGGKTITEVIDGLSFKAVYGVTFNVAPAYQTTEQADAGQMTVVPGYGAEVTVEKDEEPAKTYTLTVEDSNHGYVIVKPVDSTYASGDTEDGNYVVKNVASGAQFKLTAVADSGYTFSGWSGDTTGSSTSKTITVTKNMTISAKFNSSSTSGSGSSSSGNGSSSTTNGSGSGQIARPNQNVTTGGSTPSFQDLTTVPWAVNAVNTLASLGIINGRSDTIFDPNASVTRAEFTKMVCLTFGFAEMPNASQKFVDVTPSDWFYGYVMAAASNGIVNGISDTAFDPNATITRQDMAAILYRAASATGMLTAMSTGEAINFADYDQISDYAVAPVTTLSAAGVINGTTDNKFEPLATATRAQAACIIYQYYQAIGAI